jgi:hypothetical protein
MNEQLRFSNDGNKLLDKSLIIESEIKVGDILFMVDKLSPEEITKLIIIIDEHSENWSVTEELFQYFSSEILKNGEANDKSIKLISNLYEKFCKE